MAKRGESSIRQSILGADRGLRVIDGGGGDVPPPPLAQGGDCPVMALGHRDGMFHFLDVRGQKRELSARQLGARHDLLALFGGDDGWLRKHHPKKKQVGEADDKTPILEIVDFSVNASAAELQRLCFQAGLFGDHILVRQPGIWRGPDGDPIVHCGDQVMLGDAWAPAGARTGHQIWAAAPPTPRPAAPCPAAIAAELQAGLAQFWRWREAGGPVALLGLIANAFYGAATEWRPAGFVTGDTGSGKSALLDLVRGCLPLHHHSNDSSKSGIEGAVNGRAMPIVIDEAADRANRDMARNLIDLVLSASSGEGTKGVRGTVDGKGRKIDLCGLIFMFSINPPELEPQHLGRFAMIEVLKPLDGADHRAQHAALVAYARQHGAALWGRALGAWERYNAALAAFRDGLGLKGCAPRERDQAGALAAGWWVLTREGVPDSRGVAEGIGALDGFVRLSRSVAADGRPLRALNHLLCCRIELHRSTEREPIGKLLEIALGQGSPARSPEDTAELLLHYGIRVVRRCVNFGLPRPIDGCRYACCFDVQRGRPVPRMGDDAGVWIANGHPDLARLYAGTPFDGGRWRHELLRLDGAKPSGRSVRIGRGVTPGHAIWLDRQVLDPPDEPDDG